MSGEEAFRVAVIGDMRREPLTSVSRACDRARDLVCKILAPLDLGQRLEFQLDQDPCGRGWLVVWIHASGQLPLFAQLEAVACDVEGTSAEAASVRDLLKTYLADIKNVMQQVRISGYELEEVASRLADVAKVRSAFGLCFGQDLRVRVDCGGQHVESFSLCGTRGRHIHSCDYGVRFSLKLLGRHQLRAVLSSPSRVDLGTQRREYTVYWDRDVVDRATWRYLVDCLDSTAMVNATVRKVIKSTGTVGELLATDIQVVQT